MFYSLMHQRPDDKCHSPRLRRKRQVFVNIQRYIKSQWGGVKSLIGILSSAIRTIAVQFR